MSIEFNFDFPQERESVFQASLPWGASTAALAVFGAGAAVKAYAAGSTALAVAGVALALFGSYGTLAVTCTALNASSANEFRRKIKQTLTVAASAVFADMVSAVAHRILARLIDDLLGNNRRRNG